MSEFVGALLVIATLPATLELLLTGLGVLFYRAKPLPILKEPPPRTAVVVPAHNEEFNIKQTLRTIQQCTGVFDILVIADNCTDATAQLAREEKVQVLEQQFPLDDTPMTKLQSADPLDRDEFIAKAIDEERYKGDASVMMSEVDRRDRRRELLVLERNSPLKGKHYTLTDAFAHFPNYDLYIIIDADTQVEPNLVEIFQTYFLQGWQAIQGLYLLPPVGTYASSRLASIAFTDYNAIRPMGRAAFGFSCGLFGNGIALSRTVVQEVPFPKDTIVEDAAYHLELVKKGIRVALAPETKLIATHPETAKDSSMQQQRWQGGRLRLWLDQAWNLLKEVLKGKWRCIEPLLDLSTPPLAYYTIALLLLLLTPFKLYATLGFALLAVHLVETLVYRKKGLADILALALIPYYLLKRLFSLGQIWKGSRKGQAWIRTKRKGEK